MWSNNAAYGPPCTHRCATAAAVREGVVDVVEQRRIRTALHPPLQRLRQGASENVRESEQAPLIRIQGVDGLDLFVQIAIIGEGHRVRTARLDEDFDEAKEEVHVRRGRRQAKRIDLHVSVVQGDVPHGPTEIPRQRVVAAPEIEDHRPRAIALEMRDQKVHPE